MKHRNLIFVTAVTLCLASASVFAAGGFEAESVGFVEKVFNLIMLIFPWAAGLAFIVSCALAISRGWGPIIVTTTAIFLIGAVKLLVNFASGMTI